MFLKSVHECVHIQLLSSFDHQLSKGAEHYRNLPRPVQQSTCIRLFSCAEKSAWLSVLLTEILLFPTHTLQGGCPVKCIYAPCCNAARIICSTTRITVFLLLACTQSGRLINWRSSTRESGAVISSLKTVPG